MPHQNFHHIPNPKRGIDPLKNITPAHAPDILHSLILDAPIPRIPLLLLLILLLRFSILIFIVIPSQDSPLNTHDPFGNLPWQPCQPRVPTPRPPMVLFLAMSLIHKAEYPPPFAHAILRSHPTGSAYLGVLYSEATDWPYLFTKVSYETLPFDDLNHPYPRRRHCRGVGPIYPRRRWPCCPWSHGSSRTRRS